MTPFQELFLAAMGLSLLSQTVYIILVNQDFVEKKRKEIKEITSKVRELNPSSKEYKELLSKQMKINMDVTKHTMKPTMVTIIPFFLVFSFLRSRFEGMTIVDLPFSLFGKTTLGWVGTFLIVSLVVTSTIQYIHKQYRKRKKGDENAKTISETNEKNSEESIKRD